MEDEASLFELDSGDLLRRKIKHYQQKVKAYKAIIKQTEAQLAAVERQSVLVAVPSLKRQQEIVEYLYSAKTIRFSTTTFKPKVYNFLHDNPTKFTTEQILVGIDTGKVFQKENRAMAIRAISSSLFQLHKAGRIEKFENPGRRGFKWAIKEPAPNLMTGAG